MIYCLFVSIYCLAKCKDDFWQMGIETEFHPYYSLPTTRGAYISFTFFRGGSKEILWFVE